MSFGGGDQPAPMQMIGPAPTAPANPPMFGEQARRAKPKGQQPSMQFTASILGGLPDQAQKATKTLLGQ